MRVAIAGSTGLLGSAIAKTLASSGHEIVRIGRTGSEVALDLAHPARLAPGALARCDALVHAAGVTDEDMADRERAFAKAGPGAQALLDAAREGGVPRLLYVSSAHVYGPLEGVIDESHRVDPRSDYARAHVTSERLFEGAARNSPGGVLIARPCAVFGMPRSLERFARWALIPFDFPRQALHGRIVLRNHGAQRRNFVSAHGVAMLASWWLQQERPGVTIANAAGPEEMSVYDFATLCARIATEETGRDCAVERPPQREPMGPPLEYRTQVSGHLPGPSLEEHLRSLIRALTKRDSP